jgi:hypothetical protein
MSEQLLLAAAGDVILSSGYWDAAHSKETQGLFGDLGPLLADRHIAVANLEGPLTERAEEAPPWRFCLRGHPIYAQVLRSVGFGALSLANNHIMDSGWQAVEETVELLSKAGIGTFGAGVNLAAARAPLRRFIGGMNVAFLGYTDVIVAMPVYATEKLPGVAPAKISLMIEDIRAAREKGDLVVVSLHWGQEMVGCPSLRQRKVARQLIAAGASLILGHHAHVLQGVERIDGGLVAYGLGTYSVCEEEWKGRKVEGESFQVMHMGPDDRWRRQAILKVGLAPNGAVVAHRLIPTYIQTDMRVVHDTRPERIAELEWDSAILSKRFYSFRWGSRALSARINDWAAHIHQGKLPLWKIALRLRPRHLKRLVRGVANELQQFRGMK